MLLVSQTIHILEVHALIMIKMDERKIRKSFYLRYVFVFFIVVASMLVVVII